MFKLISFLKKKTFILRLLDQKWQKLFESYLKTVNHCTNIVKKSVKFALPSYTDYGRSERKLPSLHGWKFNPKLLGTAEAYFVCHIGPIFQISLIYAFIGCP